MILPFPDMVVIFLVAMLCSAIVGGFGLGALWLSRRRPLTMRLGIIVATTLGSVLTGMIAISSAMYLSEHDLIVFLTVAVASLLSTLLVTWVLARLIAREYRDLKRMTAEVGMGHRLGAVSNPKDISETAQLKAELIATSDKLADSRDEVAALDRSRRELIAWFSHDLRTPMAGLKAMAEALEDGMVDEPTRYYEKIRIQIDRLSRMVDDLFALSRIQSGSLELDRVEIGLYDLVSDAVADLRLVASLKNITVQAQGLSDVMVVGDPRELTRVVENLLMNAVQHSPVDSHVTLETSLDPDGHAVLTVTDDGGGIDSAELSQIFDTGWRGTPARTPEETPTPLTGGAGLGLAIVRGIVEAHAGTVSVSNTTTGAQFEVRLPSVASSMSQ